MKMKKKDEEEEKKKCTCVCACVRCCTCVRSADISTLLLLPFVLASRRNPQSLEPSVADDSLYPPQYEGAA